MRALDHPGLRPRAHRVLKHKRGELSLLRLCWPRVGRGRGLVGHTRCAGAPARTNCATQGTAAPPCAAPDSAIKDQVHEDAASYMGESAGETDAAGA